MMKRTISTAAFCLATAATAATAQTEAEAQAEAQTEAQAGAENQAMTQQEMDSADAAVERMYVEVYGNHAPAYMTPNEAIARLQELGYTNIHDFDVEFGHYEIEADAPDGNDVEIEIDPVTGAILDIEDNWF